MIGDGELVAIFNNIHKVLKAEKLLKERRIDILLIPAPRSLQSDCGLALRYAEKDRELIERVLAEAELLPGERYRLTNGKYVRISD